MKYLVETLLNGIEVKSARLTRTPDANRQVKLVIRTNERVSAVNLERAQEHLAARLGLGTDISLTQQGKFHVATLLVDAMHVEKLKDAATQLRERIQQGKVGKEKLRPDSSTRTARLPRQRRLF